MNPELIAAIEAALAKRDIDEDVKLLKSVEARIKTCKTVGDMQRQPYMVQMVALSKGLIEPGDLRIDRELRPEESRKLYSTIINASQTLTKVMTERTSALFKDLNLMDMNPRQLTRIAEGEEPEDDDKAGPKNKGGKALVLPAQLFADIPLTTLRDNASNPQIVSFIRTMVAQILANDFTDLAWNGVADDHAGKQFVRLNKGWIKILQDADEAHKPSVDLSDGWIGALGTIQDASDALIEPRCEFFMNTKDANAYNREVARHVTGSAIIATGSKQDFQAVTVHPDPYIPRGTVIYTPPKNLVMVQHGDIRRTSAYHARRRVLEITIDQANDYAVRNKAWAVLAQVAPAPEAE